MSLYASPAEGMPASNHRRLRHFLHADTALQFLRPLAFDQRLFLGLLLFVYGGEIAPFSLGLLRPCPYKDIVMGVIAVIAVLAGRNNMVADQRFTAYAGNPSYLAFAFVKSFDFFGFTHSGGLEVS